MSSSSNNVWCSTTSLLEMTLFGLICVLHHIVNKNNQSKKIQRRAVNVDKFLFNSNGRGSKTTTTICIVTSTVNQLLVWHLSKVVTIKNSTLQFLYTSFCLKQKSILWDQTKPFINNDGKIEFQKVLYEWKKLSTNVMKAENGYRNHHHTFQSKYVIEIEAPM